MQKLYVWDDSEKEIKFSRYTTEFGPVAQAGQAGGDVRVERLVEMSEILSMSPWADRQEEIRQSPFLSYPAALSRIAELEAALEPFKKAADNFDSMPVKDPESWFAYSGSQSHTEVMGAISVGDLRRARAAFSK